MQRYQPAQSGFTIIADAGPDADVRIDIRADTTVSRGYVRGPRGRIGRAAGLFRFLSNTP